MKTLLRTLKHFIASISEQGQPCVAPVRIDATNWDYNGGGCR